MKILQLIETGGGGSGRHFLDLVAGLVERGHDVTALYSPNRAEAGFVQDLQAIPGISLEAVPMRRAVTPADFGDFRRLSRRVAALGPFDITHGHSSKAGAFARLLPARLAGKRIYTPHAMRTMSPTLRPAERLIYGGFEKMLARRTDCVIAVSDDEAAHIRSLCPGIACRTILNGITPPVPAERAGLRAQLGIGSDALVAVFVGRLSEQKDPGRFVEAVMQAGKRIANLQGLVVGDGDLRPQIDTAATRGRVLFLGWRKDAAEFLPAADLFVLSSRFEAMPYSLIEALHAGLPILTTRVGGAEDVVAPGQNGRIVARDCTAQELAGAMGELFSDSARLSSMGAESKARSHAFLRATMVERTEAVFLETLAGDRPPH